MKKSIRNKIIICAAIIAAVLIADQWLKIWIKTHFAIGDGIHLIGDWCQLFFIENEGMAFGFSFGGDFGKLMLTLIRIVASAFIVYFIVRQLKKDARYMVLISLALILVGAVGNIVDSCFYGLIFSESTHTEVATLFPDGGGYGRFLYGRVVDMFYFPIAEWVWPGWLPVLGGRHAEFFGAIFNLADASICVGVALLLIDQLLLHKESSQEEAEEAENNDPNLAENATDNASDQIGQS